MDSVDLFNHREDPRDVKFAVTKPQQWKEPSFKESLFDSEGMILNRKNLSFQNNIRPSFKLPALKFHSKWTVPKLMTRYRTAFNAVDVALGKNLLATRRLVFGALAGAKTAWTDRQNQIGSWSIFHPVTKEIMEPFDALMQQKEIECGPCIGIDGRMRIGRSGMGIRTQVAASVLWNQIGLNSALRRAESLNSAMDVLVRPMTEIYFGFDWHSALSNGTGQYDISAGYEGQYWWDQIDSLKSIPLDPNSDLTFHGFSIKVRVSF